MNTKKIIILLNKIAQLNNEDFNLVEVEQIKNRFVSNQAKDFNDILNELKDIAGFLNRIYLPNAFKKSWIDHPKFNELKCLVFNRKTNELNILYKNENELFVYFVNDEYKIVESKIDSTRDFLIWSEAKSLNYNFSKNNDFEDDDLFILNEVKIENIIDHNSIENKENKHEKHHEHANPVVRFFKLLKAEREEIQLIYFYAILIGIINLAVPLAIQGVISFVSSGVLFASIVVLIILVAATTAVSGWLQILQLSIVEILQQKIFAKISLELTFKIPKVKYENIKNIYFPELVNRFFDVITIQKALPKILIDITAAGLQILFGLLLLAFYHPVFIGFGVILIVVLFLIFKGTSREGLETSINESKYKYKLAYWLEELAKNVRSFKMAGNTSYHIDKSDKLLTNYLKYRNKHFKILKKQYAAIIVFKTFITVSLLAIGAALVINRQINLGQFVAAEIIILLVIASVEKLISTIEVIYDILTGIDKLGHLTDLPLEKNTGLSVSQAGCAKNVNIQINNLNYSHFLKNINLTIQQGEKIVITGGHSSGKSALVSILSGLYQNYTGNVLVNGVSLQDINVDDYRSIVNMCSPRDEVFEGSIEDNIMIGRRKINLSKLIEITQALGLDEYINENKEGLNTTLGGSIDSVAYNYKQKLIIARTLVEEPHMVIIDEMFFNNKEKKSKVLKYLFENSHHFTLILVSNDNYAFQLADRIIKLEHGEIVFDDKADNFINHND